MSGIIVQNLTNDMKNYIRVYRALKRIKQQQLADAIGVSTGTINLIENCKHCPSFIVAAKIARYFGTTIEKIFVLTDEELGLRSSST